METTFGEALAAGTSPHSANLAGRKDAHGTEGKLSLQAISIQAPLWRRVIEAAHSNGITLPRAPRNSEVKHSESAEELEWCALYGLSNTPDARRLPWNYSLRAHADRITCLKLVAGPSRRARKRRRTCETPHEASSASHTVEGVRGRYRRQAWLITGAIDGWVRVWDIGRMIEEEQGKSRMKAREDSVSRGPPSDAATESPASLSDQLDLMSLESQRTGSTTPVQSKPPILGGDPLPLLTPRRRAGGSANGPPESHARLAGREYLVCSICTAADVTALDAELVHTFRDGTGQGERTKLRIACGSYYGDAAVTLYELELPEEEEEEAASETSRERRGCARDATLVSTLSPSAWCGVQCLVLRGSLIAVGTYTGLIHLWQTGIDPSSSTSRETATVDKAKEWKHVIERPERKSVAALRLELGKQDDGTLPCLLLVTRTGELEWWTLALPESAGEMGQHVPLSTQSSLQADTNDGATSDSLESFAPVRSGPHSTLRSRKDVVVEPGQESDPEPQMLSRFSLGDGLTPMLGLGFSEPDDDVAGRLTRRKRPGKDRCLSLMLGDMTGVSHWQFSLPKESSSDWEMRLPYISEPVRVGRREVVNERPIGLAFGQSGDRAIFHSSLGGVPPLCCVRLYHADRSDMAIISPFEGLAEKSSLPWQAGMRRGVNGAERLPSAAGSAPLPSPTSTNLSVDTESEQLGTPSASAGPTSSSNLSSALAGLRGRQRPAVGGSTMRMFEPPPEDSGSASKSALQIDTNAAESEQAAVSTSTFTSNAPAHQHGIKRADILTEAAYADSLGITIFATARGYLHITDWCTSAPT
ncbi:WD40/YVTN repeat-like-containing domain [Ceraceosorus bombacis]|uniref:WD40/YVTN repeat-like-containing domain n=1 Tax=Ceraceosorus bombacis TaxID=401625 RepID=A0A0P1B806_9BASI|nr:WD40/YVTN repeat-like-containing domain [Ceraceosorus bombacis]